MCGLLSRNSLQRMYARVRSRGARIEAPKAESGVGCAGEGYPLPSRLGGSGERLEHIFGILYGHRTLLVEKNVTILEQSTYNIMHCS